MKSKVPTPLQTLALHACQSMHDPGRLRELASKLDSFDARYGDDGRLLNPTVVLANIRMSKPDWFRFDAPQGDARNWSTPELTAEWERMPRFAKPDREQKVPDGDATTWDRAALERVWAGNR